MQRHTKTPTRLHYGTNQLQTSTDIFKSHVLGVMEETNQKEYNIVLDLGNGECLKIHVDLTTWDKLKGE